MAVCHVRHSDFSLQVLRIPEASAGGHWLLGVTACPEVLQPLWLPHAWRRDGSLDRGVDDIPISCTPSSGSSGSRADIE